MERRRYRSFPLALVAVVLTLLFAAPSAFTATLYDVSREKLAVRAEKALAADYTFVVLGDSRDNDGVFRTALAKAKSFSPLFILHLGDYSARGTAEETEHFLAMLRETVPEIPCFVVFGNHENRGHFERAIGPRRFALDLPRLNLRLVAVDNADNMLRPSELGYLREQLTTKERTTFVAMHVPPRTQRWSWHSFSDGAEEATRLLAEKGVRVAFYGHVHVYDRDEIRGVPSVITGGAGAPLTYIGYPGEALHHIVVVRVKGGTATATMVPLGK